MENLCQCNTCKFTHLHNHTVYSKLDGAISANLVFDRLKEIGMDTFCKTDHGTLAGVFDFANAAEKHGMKMVAGCEFYEVNTIAEKFIGVGDCREPEQKMKREEGPDGPPDQKNRRYWHVTMLAKNKEGYMQLVKLSTAANSKDAYFYKPRIDENMMRQIIKPGSVFLGTGCTESRMSRTALTSDDMKDLDKDLDYYHSIFGADNIFVEIMATGYEPQKLINEKMIELANKRGLRICVTNDAHFTRKSDAKIQDALVCMSTNQYMYGERTFKFEGDDYYLKSVDEMRAAFRKHQNLEIKDEWLTNAHDVAAACDHAGLAKSPDFKLPKYRIEGDRLFGEFQKWADKNRNWLGESFGLTKDEINTMIKAAH